MLNKLIFSAFIIVFSLGYSGNVTGQKLEQKLSKHLKDYNLNFASMMQFKGMKYNSNDQNIQILYNLLETYDDQTGILFFHFKLDTLHVWLLTMQDGYNNLKGVKKTGPNYGYSLCSEIKLFELESEFRTIVQEGKIGEMRGGVTENTNTSKNNSELVLNELNNILFPEKIKHKLKNLNKLLVVPALNISTIPIYLLDPIQPGELMIENYTISYVHNFQHLLGLHWGGLFNFEKLEYNLIGFSNFSNCEQFEDLPGVEKELKSARDSINNANQLLSDNFKNNGYQLRKPTVSFNLNDSSAVERIEKSTINDTRRILYLATHASSNPNNPLDSNFLVTNTCENITERTLQFMDHSEILLVILSACQTGQGKTMNTGTLSVGRAFLKGNARNVISTLWSIDDQATAEFIELFIHEITDFQIESIKDLENDNYGFDMVFYPAHQLRQAMLKYKKVDPDPNHWAAFISTGSPIKGFVISY